VFAAVKPRRHPAGDDGHGPESRRGARTSMLVVEPLGDFLPDAAPLSGARLHRRRDDYLLGDVAGAWAGAAYGHGEGGYFGGTGAARAVGLPFPIAG
jgi:hypothetical protein